jgi:hypothetical protein
MVFYFTYGFWKLWKNPPKFLLLLPLFYFFQVVYIIYLI